jgi:hypothetical protein
MVRRPHAAGDRFAAKRRVDVMTRIVAGALLATVVVAAAPLIAQNRTVTGELVDLECSLEKGAGGRGNAHGACAMDCARRGNQMAILTDDAVYVIRGDYAANHNAKLLDFVARRVEAKGHVEEADGKQTITVASMALLK